MSTFTDESCITKRNMSTPKNTVLVSSSEQILTLKEMYPDQDLKIKLIVTRVDDELIDLLLKIDVNFDIILKSNTADYSELESLSRFKKEKNGNIYLAYDVDENSPFNRSKLIYYINVYGITLLLNCKCPNLYNIWFEDMIKYTQPQKIKKLSGRYLKYVKKAQKVN